MSLRHEHENISYEHQDDRRHDGIPFELVQTLKKHT